MWVRGVWGSNIRTITAVNQLTLCNIAYRCSNDTFHIESKQLMEQIVLELDGQDSSTFNDFNR